MVSVRRRNGRHIEDLRPGEDQSFIRTACVDGTSPARTGDFVGAIRTDRLEQFRILFGRPPPDLLTALGIQARDVAAEMAEVDSAAFHAQSPAVDRQLFAVAPQNLLGSGIDRQQRFREPPGMIPLVESLLASPTARVEVRGVVGIEAFGYLIPRPAACRPSPSGNFDPAALVHPPARTALRRTSPSTSRRCHPQDPLEP